MTTFAVINQKGGVGKTTTAVNFSYGLAQRNKKVLLIDLDPQGHSSEPYMHSDHEYNHSISEVLSIRGFDIAKAIYPAFVDNKKVDNLFIMPSNISLALTAEQLTTRHHREKILSRAISDLENKFDDIVIDCPPNLGVLAINGIFFASKFLIPVKADKRALDGVSDLFLTINEVKEGHQYEYHIFRIDIDSRNTQTNAYIDNELSNYQDNLLKTIVRRNEAINQA